MKITQLKNEDIKIEMETDLDATFWNNIKKDRREWEAENKSLGKQVKILAEDNSYLRFMLDSNNIKYNKLKS
jgi:hypothetical protein